MIYIKGFLRYEGYLNDGLLEISANKNYVTERTIKNISIELNEVFDRRIKN